MRTALAFIALLALGTGAGTLQAQNGPAPRFEMRLDGFAGPMDAAHLSTGAAIPLGTYARLALLAGAGPTRLEDRTGGEGDVGFGGRVEALGRFHFDPVRQSSWGPYAGAGVSLLGTADDCCDGLLTLLIGLEGPYRNGRSWAFEVGFGGGVRAAIVLRGGGARWR